MRILPDTNIFNSILDGSCPPDVLASHHVFVTHIQKDELQRTADMDRRAALMATFETIPSASTPTRTAVWDDTPWGESGWSAKGDLYDRLLARIKELDSLAKKKKKSANQSRDARIAEVAIADQIVLITNDQSLAKATAEHGGTAMSLSDLQKHQEPK